MTYEFCDKWEKFYFLRARKRGDCKRDSERSISRMPVVLDAGSWFVAGDIGLHLPASPKGFQQYYAGFFCHRPISPLHRGKWQCCELRWRRLLARRCQGEYSTRDEPALVKSQRTPPSSRFSVVHPAIDSRKTSSTCLSANRLRPSYGSGVR